MTIGVIVIFVICFILIKFIADTKADIKSFQVIPFRDKFGILVEFFEIAYFKNNCSIHTPLKTEVRIIGNGMNANKMVQIYYVRQTLYIEIKIKLYQVEYKQKYSLEDALLKTDEALGKFGKVCLEDFYTYLNNKTM